MKNILKIFVVFFFVYGIILSQTWQLQNSNLPENATAAPFSPVSDSICWAVWTTDWNDNSSFVNGYLKTIDGGQTWTSDTIKVTENGCIWWIEAFDENTAFIAVETWAANGMQGIYKTTDGGKTWQKHPTAYANSYFGPGYVHFFDANNGVAVGEIDINNPNATGFEIYTTNDGGKNWNHVSKENIPTTKDEYLEPVQVAEYGDCIWLTVFESKNHGPRFLKTTDKGYNWKFIEPNGIDTTFDNMFASFQNENVGMMVGWSWHEPKHIVKKTYDGGATWKDIAEPYGCIPLNVSYVPGTDSTYMLTGDVNVAGYHKGSAYSNDFGHTWTTIDSGSYSYLKVASENVAWATNFYTNKFYKYEGPLVSVENNDLISTNFFLEQNYPNPFNPSTTIKYSIPTDLGYEVQDVRLKIYDILGREVATLVNQKQKPGNYKVEFDGKDLPSGVYLYRLKIGIYTSVKKMMLMK